MNRKVLSVAIAVALIPLGGCFPKSIQDHNPLAFFMNILSGQIESGLTVAGTATKTRIETIKDLYFDADVGGLDGVYDVTFHDGEGTTYGTFSGTTAVKRGRFITIKDSESVGLFAMVAALAAEQAGGAVTIEKAKAKVTAYQTPGGVEVVYKAKITFKGFVTSGPNTGAKIRGGKMSTAGVYPQAD